MITHLSIRGLAIIEELKIEFSPQLNVITGETGAGKSILIKALQLLLGAKADPDVIRKGFERAYVAASFLLPKTHPSIDLIQTHGLVGEDSDLCELIIRREINQKGRSQAWINDQPVSSSFLKDVGQTLIDIYGQHENHRMLDASTHMDYIDQFLKESTLPGQVQQMILGIQNKITDIRRRLEQYLIKKREQDYLQYRFDEISKFQPSRDDFEEVSSICQRVSKALGEQKIISQAQALCDEAYMGRPISSAAKELIKLMSHSRWLKEDSEFQRFSESIQELTQVLDEFSFYLGKISAQNSIDEREVERAQERLAQYQAIFRKMGTKDIDEMMRELGRLESELVFVLDAPVVLGEEIRDLHKKVEQADRLVQRLTEARKHAAALAVSQIIKELQDLNMKGSLIQFDFQPIKQSISQLDLSEFEVDIQHIWAFCAEFMLSVGKTGRERGQFLLAANPGEGFKPLAKVASGGEISRIMLGFKKALAVGANTCVMVFDEIDTGISGQTANIVGRKLKELSEKFQVICISHLPQVAVYGDAHFKVEKSLRNKSTESRIYRLNQDESEQEIARLLSGDQVTKTSLNHAQQLIKAAKV